MAKNYSDYEVVVGADCTFKRVRYSDADNYPGALMRVTCLVGRIPAAKRIEVHFFVGATADDRENALSGLIEFFEEWGHIARREKTFKGKWAYVLHYGVLVEDDPFVQLELEMMIDNYASDKTVVDAILDGTLGVKS